ncbi:MAG TPA: UDP-N-acetylmuramoyl-tripeptide--D-alanyl-D-alanine ligase [Vicinamibacterales bacterium]|nr:UDP-N-acetylmuramoyl-tripeptide--D-alanyl-D-alanine ligase [Vicinamibacterales bacterium]
MTAIPLTAASVAAAAGGAVVAGDPGQAFDGVSIDTRTLRRGELFVAIRGERFDGAEFVDAAIDAGAAGVVIDGHNATAVAERRGSDGRIAVVGVNDTTIALQALARAIRRESGAKVVAITGSAGKTTTKEVTAELLHARYRVIRNRGNFNNHIGLPLSLIELRQKPEIAVVELGMNHAGEISTLVRIAEPDVRVWTNVGEAHLGFFASLDAIADAKAEILEAARPSDLLVANADDARIAARMPAFPGRVTTFGIDRDADVRADQVVDRGIEGTSARVTTPRGEVELTTPLVGRGNLANVLAATAVALEFGVPLADIARKAAALRPASHRGEIVRLAQGVTLIDDSYNANPTATKRAIEVLAGSRASRRIAVIGEMLELGDHAEELHADVGRAAAQAGLDALIAVGGGPARALADAAITAGMPAAAVRHVATSDDAADAAAALLRAGDLVLVKGSRGIRTDRVVERLKSAWGG